jgi:hypothetical protein
MGSRIDPEMGRRRDAAYRLGSPGWWLRASRKKLSLSERLFSLLIKSLVVQEHLISYCRCREAVNRFMFLLQYHEFRESMRYLIQFVSCPIENCENDSSWHLMSPMTHLSIWMSGKITHTVVIYCKGTQFLSYESHFKHWLLFCLFRLINSLSEN